MSIYYNKVRHRPNLLFSMIPTRKKGRYWTFLENKLLWLALAAVIVFGSLEVSKAFQKYRGTVVGLDLAEERQIKMENRRDTLMASIEKLKTERGMEEELREKFPVAKAGEEVMVIVDDKDTEPAAVENSFWSRIRKFFGLPAPVEN